ncbi:hypothetical protein AC623_13760 [Bacillus sp. FJAT-27231]|uniref:hypothetical protein n=1 Tax=Bacillus sp. FJAT-27231 TaxID=1679168 RepID=UPI0006716647|nr:hypothetical protein [Bacillus sp. FJAT-27231]KMY54869.1 hypothetical protein AC623_13760 [Bacillus sp. FJAT-27231]
MERRTTSIKKSGADCSAPTSIRRNGEVAFFSHTARAAYNLEEQGGAAGQEEKRRVLVQRCMDWTAPHEIKETRRAEAIRC